MKLKKPSQEVLDEARYYQYVLNGKTMIVAEMDRGQLMQALMKTIDLVENIDGHIDEAVDAMKRWQARGEVATDE